MTNTNWRAKLLRLFAIVLAAVFLLLLGYIIPEMQRQEVVSVIANQERAAQCIASEQDQDLQRFAARLQLVAKQSGLRDMDSGAIDSILRVNSETSPLISNLAVFNAGGRLVSGGLEEFSIFASQEHAAEPYFDIPFEQGKTFFGAPHFLKMDGVVGIPISVPIMSHTGEPLGVLAGGFLLNELLDLVDRHARLEGSASYVVDSQGTVVRHTAVDLLALDGGPLSLDYRHHPLVEAVISGEQFEGHRYEYQGTDYYGSYAAVESSGWGVVVETPRKAALAGVIALRVNMLLGIAAILTLALVFALLAVCRRS